MASAVAIDGSAENIKIRAENKTWMDDLDCMPLIKRRRLLLSGTPSPSSPVPSSNPSMANCRPPIDMAVKGVSLGASQEWPGLPRGVKFDPSDGDLFWHLCAKVGKGDADPHPLISEFISSFDEDDRFGYTHPEKLPGVKKDGSASYFFHRSFKIHDDDSEDIFWHKVGKTRPVIVDGSHQGCKKIMVLYVSMEKGKKPKKSSWVMHQYHLGTGNGEERELIVSKIFYKQGSSQDKRNAQEFSMETVKVVAEAEPLLVAKLDISMADCDLVTEGNKNSGLVNSVAVNSDVVRSCSFNAADSKSEHLLDSSSLVDTQAYTGISTLIALSELKDHAAEQGGNDPLQQSILPYHSTEIKVECSDFMQTNPRREGLEEADLEMFASECEKDDLDHVTLQERCSLLSSSIHSVSGDLNGSECCQDFRACTIKPCSSSVLHAQDGGFISKSERGGTLMNHLGNEKCGKDILDLLQDISSGPYIHPPSTKLSMGECYVDSVFESHDAKSMNNLMFNSLDNVTAGFDLFLQTSLNHQHSMLLEASQSLENHENNCISVYQTSGSEVKPPVLGNKCAIDSSEPHCSELSAQRLQTKVEPLEQGYVNNISEINAAVQHCALSSAENGGTASSCTASPCTPDQNDSDQVDDSILPIIPVEVKVEPWEESGTNSVPEANAESRLSSLQSGYSTEISRTHTQCSSKDHHFQINSSLNGSTSQENMSTCSQCSDQKRLPKDVINLEAPKLLSSKISGFMNSTYLENSLTISQCSAMAGNYQENILSNGDCLLEESDRYCSGQVSFPGEICPGVNNMVSNSVRVKTEPLESGLLSKCENHVSSLPESDVLGADIKRETPDELSVDVTDHILKVGQAVEPISGIFSNVDHGDNQNCSQQCVPHGPGGSVNSRNAKSSHFALRRRRKKTATDSVETALEEDAPGLLQVLLDKGIAVEEIKLYGDVEDDEALEVSSTDESFDDLETVMTKLFSERTSLIKLSTARHVKGSKAVYCLDCLISLIQQTQYLQFRNSPVEWGWCRELQSFIFVFKMHNRIVLERPEYGYATYFFELVDSLPIPWQIRRLVTAMKLINCSRSTLIENKPLSVGEDLSKGEARIMEEYGWTPNTGLGTMLSYCDRVVHDKKNEKHSSEWRAKIGRLLMIGHDGGRTVLINLPKNVVKYMENHHQEIKLFN